jgi:hypothetical protein
MAPPAAAFTTTVTGLTPQPAFATGNSGGGDGGGATLGPALGQPGAPVDGNPGAPAQDNPAPMPAAPAPGAPVGPDAALGVFGGGVLAGDAAMAAAGAAAFAWDDGECPTLPGSGAAVAALLMALGYSGAGRARRPEEDERWRAVPAR